MKKLFAPLFGSLLSAVFVLLFFAGPQLNAAYAVSTTKVDGVEEFNAFLERCSARERVMLLQILQAFTGEISDDVFGKVSGLLPLENYSEDPQKEQKDSGKKLLRRPRTWNDVSADTVLDAVGKGYITLDYSQQAIRTALTWWRYSKLNHAWRSTQEIDYHRDILRWVADEKGVDEDLIMKHSTFDLERAVARKFLQQIWDKLTAAQREQLNRDLESGTGFSIGDKGVLVMLDGTQVVDILNDSVAFSDRMFNNTMAIIAGSTAKAFDIAIPLAAIGGVSSAVPALAAPVGWVLSAAAITGDSLLSFSDDADYIAAFVIQMNLIKTNWLVSALSEQAQQQKK